MLKTAVPLTSLLLFLAVFSCAGHVPETTDPDPSIAIIFIPGFKGSVLRQRETQKIVWLDARNAFFRIHRLKLKLSSARTDQLDLFTPGIGITQQEELAVDGILETIPLLWGLYDYDVYRSWIHTLEKTFEKKANVFSLPYDWRRDNLEGVQQLANKVRGLKEQGYERIWIIAHSMGGLITSYYLRYGQQQPKKAKETWSGAKNIDKVVLAGVPFRGSMNIFRDMQTGILIPLNGTLIPGETLNTFPSSYQLLPRSGIYEFLPEENREIPLAAYELENWQTFGWGFLRHSEEQNSEVKENRVNFMAFALEKAWNFSKRLNEKQTVETSSKLKLLNIIGENHPTLAQVYAIPNNTENPLVHLPKQAKKFSGLNDKRLYQSGDETVTVESASLPKAFREAIPSTTFMGPATHGELFKETGSKEAILQFLTGQN